MHNTSYFRTSAVRSASQIAKRIYNFIQYYFFPQYYHGSKKEGQEGLEENGSEEDGEEEDRHEEKEEQKIIALPMSFKKQHSTRVLFFYVQYVIIFGNKHTHILSLL
jgi:hypothetical protein